MGEVLVMWRRHSAALSSSIKTGSVLILVLALTACASPSNTTADTEGNRQLVVAAAALTVTLDPARAPGQNTAEIMKNVYDRVYDYKFARDANGIMSADTAGGGEGMVGSLADKIDISADGKNYTFHFRTSAKSSFGNPLTAEDAVWSWTRCLQNPGIQCKNTTTTMGLTTADQLIRGTDPQTLEVRFSAPNPLIRQFLYQHYVAIIDSTEAKKHATAEDPWADKWLALNTAGFGPYSVSEYASGQQIVLSANPGYWGPKPYFPKVIYRDVPDSSERLSLLKQHVVDIAEGLSPVQAASLKGDDSVTANQITKSLFDYMAMNTVAGPTAKVDVRKAVQFAINQSAVNTVVYQGGGLPLKNVTPTIYPGYNGSYWNYDYDPAKAKSLLTQAGYPSGFATTMLVNSDIPGQSDVAVQVQNQLAAVGIKAEILQKQNAAYLTAARSKSPDYGLMLFQTYSLIVDVCYQMATFVWGNGVVSFGQFNDPQFADDVRACLTTPDGPKRSELINNVQRIAAEQVPTASIGIAPGVYGFSSKLKGYAWNVYVQLEFYKLSR